MSSTSKKQSKRQEQPTTTHLSAETIESDVESREPDSDVDIENITPKRKSKSSSSKRGREADELPSYAPPDGMSPLEVNTTFASSPFEWDALAKRPGVELWAIRIPHDLKASRLSSLNIDLPSSSRNISGNLKTKSRSYTLVSAGHHSSTHIAVGREGRVTTAGPGVADSLTMDVDAAEREMRVEGGEEMENLQLLLPRVRQKGKLLVAPLPIQRRLVLTPDPLPAPTEELEQPLPGFLSAGDTIHGVDTSAPKKRTQPAHLFKFRNRVAGYNTTGPSTESKRVRLE